MGLFSGIFGQFPGFWDVSDASRDTGGTFRDIWFGTGRVSWDVWWISWDIRGISLGRTNNGPFGTIEFWNSVEWGLYRDSNHPPQPGHLVYTISWLGHRITNVRVIVLTSVVLLFAQKCLSILFIVICRERGISILYLYQTSCSLMHCNPLLCC